MDAGVNGGGQPNKHEQRSRATRGAILDAARAMFVDFGFAETSTERLVELAGVTRGALYYQFDDKADLFRAVVEMLAEQVAADVRRSIDEKRRQSGDDWAAMKAGLSAYVRAHLRPDVRRVLGLEGPAVLGIKEFRVIDRRTSYGLLLEEIRRLKRDRVLPDRPDEALAQVIAGGVRGAVLYLVEAHQDEQVRDEHVEQAIETLDLMLEGLRADAATSSRF